MRLDALSRRVSHQANQPSAPITAAVTKAWTLGAEKASPAVPPL
jgi:hypothetical protein